MVRVAVKSDAQNIKTLVASLSHLYLKHNVTELPAWFNETLSLTNFNRRIESSDYTNLVYELNNKIIGYISFRGNSHLFHLFVKQSHQGQGISRQLWNSILSYCVADVYTLRSSLYAVPIYKKFGFIDASAQAEKDGIVFQPMVLKV